ncbi:MAG TPA: GNAT family N-acetyltransferase [Acidimicrobiales bacterium]|nr:GNAT family N-acetyltransferase [Acidimicrobiales bacterium]
MMLRTERLLLRAWRDEDRPPFAALNADPEVRLHFPSVLDRAASDLEADRHAAGLEERGWGLWAVEVVGGSSFVGFVGLAPATFAAPFTPAVEIGWRLARLAWGRGYATEAASTVLRHAFEEVGLEEVVSFTAVENARSRRVMEKIGLTRDPADDFDHPNVPEGHPLRRHVLYRLRTSAPGRAPVGLPSS